MKKFFVIAMMLLSFSLSGKAQTSENRWTVEKAQAWYDSNPWFCGVNYIPAYAINYTAMWDKTTFDAKAIDSEIALMEVTGMNCVRVVLQYAVYADDPKYFKRVFRKFLDVCDKHKVKVMPIFFDDCVFGVNTDPKIGDQGEPLKGWYAWAWSPSPGRSMVYDERTYPLLEKYVKDMMTTFKDDDRIMLWDLYNEPSASWTLLESVFRWAREVNPSQPISTCMWNGDKKLEDFLAENCDIITYHCYKPREQTLADIRKEASFGRPAICTEWMNRVQKSLISTCLDLFLNNNQGCIMWGLVNGKDQTELPWGWRPEKGEYTGPWQHDIYRGDHSPYDPAEIQILKETIEKSKNPEEMKTDAAAQVIRRFAGKDVQLKLSLEQPKKDGVSYTASADKGKFEISGTTPVALCRGFYDLVKDAEAGIDSWSGRRLDASKLNLINMQVNGTSPFLHHFYMNVVTFGYTSPYWDEERWDEEIDRMALHGIDMPLMLVAQEAITKRVFKRIGLTDEEIDNWFSGPAHLPWFRMGNLSEHDGPLTDSWHERQLKLAHHILDRERALGMDPICPAFAGFVPEALKRIMPDAQLSEMSWCDGHFHSWMLSPDNPLFKKLGNMFIEEWQKEFGPCKYYIADSFNEMDLPFAPKGTQERHDQLANYGQAVYESICAAAPDAVWVMQGWMFGYQRNIWDKESLAALLSKVPDDKMLLIDEAEDYNYKFWKIGNNWDFYDGFLGKEWVYSVIPNMGGKNAYTGYLDFYANGGRLDALHSPSRGNLTGYGQAPEGLETNEMLFELICDAGWTADSLDVDKWLTNYQQCRYGAKVVDKKYWREVYDGFTDHPRFFWQLRPGLSWNSSVQTSEAVSKLLEAADIKALESTDLGRADLAEMISLKEGREAEAALKEVNQLLKNGDTAAAKKRFAQAESLLLDIDKKLTADFPTRTLDHWLEFPQKMASNDSEKERYTQNARRIVTIWGPPVDDYSARIWGGLISSYYLPRWQMWFNMNLEGVPAAEISKRISEWEQAWVEK